MLEILDETSGDLVAFRVSGKHLQEESHKLAGMIDARIAKYGHARCFVEIAETKGADIGSLKEGLDFDLHHAKGIERCAVVGDQAWERALVRVLHLFFRNAEIRFFELGDRDTALAWCREE